MRYAMKKKTKLLIAVILIIAVVGSLSVFLAGCKEKSNLSDEEKAQVTNEILLSVDNFSFDSYTCTARNRKIVIWQDPSARTYTLPSADKIIVPEGLTCEMYLGEPYVQRLLPSETIDTPANTTRLITVLLSKQGQTVEILVIIGNSATITPYYIALPKTEGVKYFDQYGYEIDLSNTFVSENGLFRFKIGLTEQYSDSIVTVYANGVIIYPDNDGAYTLSGVTCDYDITLEGVKKNG